MLYSFWIIWNTYKKEIYIYVLMKNILVLGWGWGGRTICLDLSYKNSVTLENISENNLNKLRGYNINTVKMNLSNLTDLRKLINKFDLIISCVPGFMGFKTLQTIIEERKNVVDISFFPEDALELSELAKKKEITAIVDAGVAPGLSNLILGYYNSIFNLS